MRLQKQWFITNKIELRQDFKSSCYTYGFTWRNNLTVVFTPSFRRFWLKWKKEGDDFDWSERKRMRREKMWELAAITDFWSLKWIPPNMKKACHFLREAHQQCLAGCITIIFFFLKTLFFFPPSFSLTCILKFVQILCKTYTDL